MTIASELSNYAHERNLPSGIRPSHALASAMSKTDEEDNKNKHKKTGGEAPIFLQQGRLIAWRKQLNPSPGIKSIIA
jgi:hypothetical protein